MEKIWFFVEGDSEENLVINLVHKRTNLILEKDELKFINNNYKNNVCYCINSGGVDKIPHKINEYNYKIEKSGSNKIIVICDVENLNCNSLRRRKIENILSSSFPLVIRYTFFNPMIEQLYWTCPETLIRVLDIFYKKSMGQNASVPKVSLPTVSKSYISEIKQLFKKHGLKYRESQFSKEFFPRVDFNQCSNSAITRLIGFIELLLNQST